MANEIKLTGTLEVNKGGVKAILAAASGKLLNMTGKNVIHKTQAIGFAAREALDLGDVVTPGVSIFWNHDPTNAITLYPDGTDLGLVTMKAGETAGPFRLASATPFAQSGVASCDLEYMIVED